MTSHPHRWPPSLRAAIPVVGVAAIATAMLWPAIYNGFPLLFADSAEYFFFAANPQVPRYRTLGYSLWIRGVWLHPSMWAAIVAQAALVGLLLRALARAIAPDLRGWRVGVALATVSVLTGLPWYASQLMPDVFALVTVLALYLMVAHWPRLDLASRLASTAGVVVGVISHVTHVAVAVAVLITLALAMRAPNGAALRAGLWRGAGTVALAFVGMVAINTALSGKVVFSRNGHAFLLARLVHTGLAQRVLDAECPRGGAFDLCPYRGELKPSAAWFLWDLGSPFQKIGEFDGTKAETSRLLRASLEKYPAEHVRLALRSTAQQLVSVETFDGLDSFKGARWMTFVVWSVARPTLPDFESARQQRSALGLRWLQGLHRVATLIAALLSLAALWLAVRGGRFDATGAWGLTSVTWSAYVINAVMCANFSGVFERYQARLAPLLVIAALVSVHAYRARANTASLAAEPARPEAPLRLANS